MEGMQHVDAIGELCDVDNPVCLFAIRNPNFLHTGADIGQPLQPQLYASEFLAERIPGSFGELMRNLP
jgi:hypothetical protein